MTFREMAKIYDEINNELRSAANKLRILADMTRDTNDTLQECIYEAEEKLRKMDIKPEDIIGEIEKGKDNERQGLDDPR